MHLIGDIGNTKTKLCILDKKLKIIKKLNIDTSKIKNQYNFKKIIFSFVKDKIINKKALFSSVVPSVFFAIKKYFKKYFNIQCQELKQTHYSKIIKIKAKKKQIGSDRIANAIGSYYTYKSDCIVLDFGTATTFDVINRGTYFGGIIAPGVNISLSTLIKRADQIPPFTLKKISKVVGNNTLSALRSGFYWGYAGMIENILRLIKKETKRSYIIILTGGYSSLFKNSIKSKVFIDEDITMKGLIELLRVK
ncbi:MAG: type III pantothenate kinase [Pelagibacteraceae bacterium]|nr:type III pantothenate kinase [Pelagibacteraceae bacterium]